MAAIGHLIVSKIIEDQSLEEIVKAGIKTEHFKGEGEFREVFDWIVDYNAKHGAVPSERAFSGQFGDIDIEDTSKENYSGLIEELLEGYRFSIIAEAMTDASAKLDKDSAKEALEILSKGVQQASVQTARIRDFNIIEGWEARIQKYREMQENPNALRGVPTGFAGLDRITHGFRPQQSIYLVGEPKRGKSLFEMIMARACHTHGLVPLFVSFEMSVEEQLSRYDAFVAKLPYDRILSGALSNKEIDRLERKLRLGKDMHEFIMSEDSSSLTTVSALRSKALEYSVDAVYVDGVYLMDDESGQDKGTPQALTSITRALKRLAQDLNIPVVGTTQVLPWKIANQRTRAITGAAIGYTSSFVQDADLILGVEKNPDKDDQAIIRVVEARTAPHAEIHVQWDWKTMEFEEVDEDGEFDESYD